MIEDINQSEQESQFIKYHDKLRSELNNISEHFEISENLAKHGSNYVPEINIAPTFFMLTLDAHRFATLMGINRMLDTDPHHLSLYKFLRFIRDNLSLFSDDSFQARLQRMGRLDELALRSRSPITAETIDNDIQKLHDLPIPNVRRWRNEVLAHIQAASVLQEVKISTRYPVKMAQIEHAISTMHDMLNFYYLNYQSIIWVRSQLTKRQPKHVMDALRFYIENRKLRS
ncbi:MAG: hypothetical protein WB588_10270 [Dehalococcoidia bacterium]